ncbi:MAG TPA: shikimate kinase [Spirochaetota bacterium]|nr:shikimate kinase [Spirochaetota bacterium]
MRLYLIGYRGSGKSSVSQKLSEAINLQIYSIDKIIENREKKDITSIVEENGWEYFRNIETSILYEISRKDNCIIDCGGGIIEKKENREILKKEKYVFFLYVEVETIKKRLKDEKDRPSLTGKDFIKEIEEVYSRRIPLYKEVANFIIDANRSLDEIVGDIIKII